MDSQNIHSFKGFAKGKREPLPKRDALNFGDYITSMPTAPLVDLAPAFTYPMDGNDRAGDCVVAGIDHFMIIVNGLLKGSPTGFTQDQIWAFYKTQNPNFDPNGDPNANGPGSSADNGMNIQLFLEYLVENKYILGFARVDWTNEQLFQAAMYIGLCLIPGFQLTKAQMQQFLNGQPWDTVPGSPIDGGHCAPAAGYTNDETDLISWAQIVKSTRAFITNQMDECWFVLTQAHIDHPDFRNHFDLSAFSKAVYAITQGKINIPVPLAPPAILPVLKIGSVGDAVKILQNDLNANGAALIADGIFGKLTQTAVINFQSWHGLVADGIVGKMTWQAFDMIKIITTVCDSCGVEPLLGIAVASCESALDPLSKLYNAASNSTDRGLYQWNNFYFAEITDAEAFNPTIACQLFCSAVKDGKLIAYWSASEPCWKVKLTPALRTKYGIV